MSEHGRFAALRAPLYRRYWLGSLGSVGATQFVMMGQAWLVHELGGEAIDLAVLGLAASAPTIIMVLLGELLVLAYTMLILTLFVELVCYKRNLEAWETIALTASLLLLVVAMSLSPLMELLATGQETNVFSLLVMVLVGLTTGLNVLVERQHSLPGSIRKWLVGIAGAMALLVLAGAVMQQLAVIQYAVAAYMGLSIVLVAAAR